MRISTLLALAVSMLGIALHQVTASSVRPCCLKSTVIKILNTPLINEYDRCFADIDELNNLLRAGGVLLEAAGPSHPPDSLIENLNQVEALIARAKRSNNALSDTICCFLHAREILSNSSHAAEVDDSWLEEMKGELEFYYALLEEVGPEISRYLDWASSHRDG